MYRGPEGTGVSSERIRTDWNTNPPRLHWRTPMTNGLSSVSVGGGRVFTQVRRGGAEYCVALDAATGRFLWTASVGLASYPDGGVGGDDGPRSTPAVRADRVYVLGSYLNLRCLDAATGTNVWSKDLRAEFGGQVIPWQNAASPLLEGDLLLVNCSSTSGALLALRPGDGGVIWRLHNERMTHATPLPATIQDERQVVFLTQSGLVGLGWPTAGNDGVTRPSLQHLDRGHAYRRK
jgi:outer membrane protein assembly factor BamB